jgi:hypothetical protein
MVRKLPRVPETDRPRFARNLGRMIEAAGSSDVHSRIAELLEDTFGCEGAASALKKRKRYVRLSTEPLPPADTPGEYHAHGATFIRLAEAPNLPWRTPVGAGSMTFDRS